MEGTGELREGEGGKGVVGKGGREGGGTDWVLTVIVTVDKKP